MAGGTPPSSSPSGDPAPGWTQVGIASWYGDPFHGRTTASGEVYDMEAATGAHRTLPFGTLLQVENLDNGRSSTLTVNDRGPFVENRILDVSRRIARELGMLGPGTARVRITVLDAPAGSGCWVVQVGAFSEEGNARSQGDRLAEDGHPVRLVESAGGLFRVQLGPLHDQDEARRLARRYRGFLAGC